MRFSQIVAEGICAVQHETIYLDAIATRFLEVAKEIDDNESLADVAAAMYEIGFREGVEQEAANAVLPAGQ